MSWNRTASATLQTMLDAVPRNAAAWTTVTVVPRPQSVIFLLAMTPAWVCGVDDFNRVAVVYRGDRRDDGRVPTDDACDNRACV